MEQPDLIDLDNPLCPFRPPEVFWAPLELTGTKEELEGYGLYGRNWEEKRREFAFVDDYVTPYGGPPPEVVCETPSQPSKGLLKAPATGTGCSHGKRVMLKRKIIKITIPEEKSSRGGKPLPKEYIYFPGDPQYDIRLEKLLPPRQTTPSPERSYCETGRPRTQQQVQRRLSLEAGDRRACVPSREPRPQLESRFGNLDTPVRPMLPRYTKNKWREAARKSATVLDEVFSVPPAPCPSTPEGASRKMLPHPFQAEYHPRLYSSGYKRPMCDPCAGPSSSTSVHQIRGKFQSVHNKLNKLQSLFEGQMG